MKKNVQPQRKSCRLETNTVISTDIQQESYRSEPEETSTSTSTSHQQEVHTSRKRNKKIILRNLWDESVAKKLFDVKSDHRIQKCVKESYCFDCSFYEDQKNERKLRMVSTEVTEEFIQEDIQRKREARTERNRLVAYWESSVAVQEVCLDEVTSEDENTEDNDVYNELN